MTHSDLNNLVIRESCMKATQSDDRGFSLIEVVMTMAIIAIAIAALLAALNTATKLQIETEKEITAKNEARRLMEAMKGYTCDQIVEMYCPSATVGVGGFDEGDDASGMITVDNTDPTLLRLTIRVRWVIGTVGGEKRYRTFEVRRSLSNEDNA